MKPVTRINREMLIAVLLVIAGIVLAFALFGAGVLWRSRASPKHLSAASPPLSRPDPSLKPLPLYERPLRPGFRALANERAGGGFRWKRQQNQVDSHNRNARAGAGADEEQAVGHAI